MRIIQNILVLLLTGIFLLSATGLFLRFHDCETCDVSDVFINLEEHEHKHIRETHEFCCSEIEY